MKRLFLFSLILMISVAAYAKTCEECPRNKPCAASEPAGDGCNTRGFSTWCTDNVWYTDGAGTMTLVYCQKDYMIDNPFTRRITP